MCKIEFTPESSSSFLLHAISLYCPSNGFWTYRLHYHIKWGWVNFKGRRLRCTQAFRFGLESELTWTDLRSRDGNSWCHCQIPLNSFSVRQTECKDFWAFEFPSLNKGWEKNDLKFFKNHILEKCICIDIRSQSCIYLIVSLDKYG